MQRSCQILVWVNQYLNKIRKITDGRERQPMMNRAWVEILKNKSSQFSSWRQFILEKNGSYHSLDIVTRLFRTVENHASKDSALFRANFQSLSTKKTVRLARAVVCSFLNRVQPDDGMSRSQCLLLFPMAWISFWSWQNLLYILCIVRSVEHMLRLYYFLDTTDTIECKIRCLLHQKEIKNFSGQRMISSPRLFNIERYFPKKTIFSSFSFDVFFVLYNFNDIFDFDFGKIWKYLFFLRMFMINFYNK